MDRQPELQVTDLKAGMPVRITFRRPDNSWREVIWEVRYADERSAILDPVINRQSYTPRNRLFDAEQVRFWDASALVEAMAGLSLTSQAGVA